MKCGIFLLAILLTFQNEIIAQTNSLDAQFEKRLPPMVQAYSEKIQGKTPQEMHKIINDYFGSPTRDIGSGVHIPVWDLPEGRLGLLTFKFRSGEVVWLIKTHNRLDENIIQGYEMAAVGNREWLGDLTLDVDENYRFTISDSFPQEWQEHQKDNFFRHQSGTFKVKYSAGLGPATLVEQVPDGSTVGVFSFIAEDGAKTDLSIATDAKARRLYFKAEAPLSFEMDTPWKNSWK